MMGRTQSKKTILIIRMSALGDVAMTIPVIYSLGSQYPEWNIRVLTQQSFSKLFINHPANVSFVFADLKGRHHGIAGLCRLAKLLGRSRIDVVADFHNVFRSWFVDAYFLLCGKKVVVVKKKRFDRWKLIRKNSKQLVEQENYAFRYLNVLTRLGFSVQPLFKSLFEKTLPTPLPSIIPKQKSGSWIGIAPFARYPNKIYPLNLMEEVVRELSEVYSVFLFGGGSDEQKILQDWVDKYPSVMALPGLLTLNQELALMSCLDVMLSMDSANMHLASLVNIPVVSVWGSTTLHCGFLGWRQKKEHAVYANISCQPCSVSGSTKCYFDHFRCLDSLSPQVIVEKICSIINEKL